MTNRERIFFSAVGLAMLAMPSLSVQAYRTGNPEENLKIIRESNKRVTDDPIIVDVTLQNAGELAAAIGDRLMAMDSLIVRGPIDKTDFKTMWEAGLHGNLKGINLAFSSPENQAIPDSAFYDKKHQTLPQGALPFYVDYITLPPNIEKIGKDAFHLTAIKELNLPPTLRVIGAGAFSGCRWIKTDCLHIPEGVEVIPWCCFSKCFGIESIELPSSIKELETLAFFDSYMKSVNLPEGLEKIGTEAFLMSDRLLELTVPESCKYIGERAFAACPSLQKLNLPSSLKKIPAKMLQGSWAIEKFDFPSSLKEIGDEAFSYCQFLTEIILPEGLEYIGVNAFRDCESIKNAYFPSTLKSIQAGAAAGWINAERIYCAAVIPPNALCDNGYPVLTPFGYYEAKMGHYPTPRDTPLYVPKGSAESYRQMAGWDYFTDIRESEDFAGAIAIPDETSQEMGTDEIFDLTGRHINNPAPGQICIKEGRKIIIR